jgi:hypothetical protein
MGKLNVTILNKLHFDIKIEPFIFKPFEEQLIEIESTSSLFRTIRTHKGLRVGKQDNDLYVKKHKLDPEIFNDFNMVYDTRGQHKKAAYIKVVEALANPILNYLPKNQTGFTDRPGTGLNLRFFNSYRINQQGKYPVGPKDVFMSHGIGDKNYWIGSRIADYHYALAVGPVWEKRMRDTGYKGEIFITGYTKLDPIFNKEIKVKENKKPYIVWAPTHIYNNKYKGRSSYPQCLSLINEIPDTYEKALSLHPSSRLGRGDVQNVSMEELYQADVIIADAGSTLYESWAIGKPVIFPDWICKKDILDSFTEGNLEYEIYDKGIGYHAKDMKDLIKLIDVALEKGMQEQETEFMEQVLPTKYRGKSGKYTAEALKQIYKSFK